MAQHTKTPYSTGPTADSNGVFNDYVLDGWDEEAYAREAQEEALSMSQMPPSTKVNDASFIQSSRAPLPSYGGSNHTSKENTIHSGVAQPRAPSRFNNHKIPSPGDGLRNNRVPHHAEASGFFPSPPKSDHEGRNVDRRQQRPQYPSYGGSDGLSPKGIVPSETMDPTQFNMPRARTSDPRARDHQYPSPGDSLRNADSSFLYTPPKSDRGPYSSSPEAPMQNVITPTRPHTSVPNASDHQFPSPGDAFGASQEPFRSDPSAFSYSQPKSGRARHSFNAGVPKKDVIVPNDHYQIPPGESRGSKRRDGSSRPSRTSPKFVHEGEYDDHTAHLSYGGARAPTGGMEYSARSNMPAHNLGSDHLQVPSASESYQTRPSKSRASSRPEHIEEHAQYPQNSQFAQHQPRHPRKSGTLSEDQHHPPGRSHAKPVPPMNPGLNQPSYWTHSGKPQVADQIAENMAYRFQPHAMQIPFYKLSLSHMKCIREATSPAMSQLDNLSRIYLPHLFKFHYNPFYLPYRPMCWLQAMVSLVYRLRWATKKRSRGHRGLPTLLTILPIPQLPLRTDI
ncbi:uncharacterized protein EI90DRAFT_3287697 [Cantharellus anzutake]|uniref:uncharacterized protein n=1 Tax=Cantharellus anzutake TaxID=1750568 RepID=UPI001904A3B9|nr:uncharacterized protein EI90DRAFT_3287697 [Cantharellus anzutake]KAF8335763.1 hypothetical protein EI90DRAFT_3287697 [Cantharellus anzutake]